MIAYTEKVPSPRRNSSDIRKVSKWNHTFPKIIHYNNSTNNDNQDDSYHHTENIQLKEFDQKKHEYEMKLDLNEYKNSDSNNKLNNQIFGHTELNTNYDNYNHIKSTQNPKELPDSVPIKNIIDSTLDQSIHYFSSDKGKKRISQMMNCKASVNVIKVSYKMNYTLNSFIIKKV